MEKENNNTIWLKINFYWRINRIDFLINSLWTYLLFFILFLIFKYLNISFEIQKIIIIPLIIYFLIFKISLITRRFHDFNWSWWSTLLLLIPVFDIIIYFMLFFREWNNIENKYINKKNNLLKSNINFTNKKLKNKDFSIQFSFIIVIIFLLFLLWNKLVFNYVIYHEYFVWLYTILIIIIYIIWYFLIIKRCRDLIFWNMFIFLFLLLYNFILIFLLTTALLLFVYPINHLLIKFSTIFLIIFSLPMLVLFLKKSKN